MSGVKFESQFAEIVIAWPKQVVLCLSHAWSICLVALASLVKRIKDIAIATFSTDQEKEAKASESAAKKVTVLEPSEPLKPSVAMAVPDTPSVEASPKIAPSSEETATASLAKETPLSAASPHQSETSVEKPPMKRNDSMDGLPDLFDGTILDDTMFSKENDEKSKSGETVPVSDLGLTTPTGTTRRHKRIDRLALSQGLSSPSPLSSSPRRPDSLSQTHKRTKTELDHIEPLVVDCPKDDDPLLASLLKGLEMQHPQLCEKDKTKVFYKEMDLREKGVEFAQHQIKTPGPYKHKITERLNADRNAYNDKESGKIKEDWNLEKESLQKDLMQKKEKKTAKERIALRDAHQKELEKLEKKYQQKMIDYGHNFEIKTNDEFLDCLKTQGFPCSTLHLFALSAQFVVPITLHENKGVREKVQTFNPLESPLQPIHLLYTEREEYKLIIYPS